MTQSLACLGVLTAVLAAAFRWDLPARPAPAAPCVAAVAPAAPAAPVKTKPRVRHRIKVKIQLPDQDNSNSSYAALGVRAIPVPADAPSWFHWAAWKVGGVNRTVISSLKDLARKGILSRDS